MKLMARFNSLRRIGRGYVASELIRRRAKNSRWLKAKLRD